MVAENSGGFSRGLDQSFRTTACTSAARLTLAIEGSGTVTSDPAGISCPNVCSELFESSVTVNLRATAAAGWTFDSWLGDSECSDGLLPMTADRSCTARFRADIQEYRLTVEKTGDGGGTVSSSPAGINCGSDCSQSYGAGIVVRLEASPNESSTFEGWSGHSDCNDGTVTMTAARSCGAAFKKASNRKYTLQVDRSGNGQGTVTSSPSGINCGSACTQRYSEGQRVTLSATAAAGATFSGWSGDSDCRDGQVTMNGDRDCTATFTRVSTTTYRLDMAKTGSGSGTVRSTPAGIDCGARCSASFQRDQAVTLTAVADTGSRFSAWAGDADCLDGSVIMQRATSCKATFEVQRIRIFLLHGIAQGGDAMVPLAADLQAKLNRQAPQQFRVVSPLFDWGVCAAANGCHLSCNIERAATEFTEFVRRNSADGESIALLGYSMGGLIARQFIAADLGGIASRRNIILLATLGTPNLGYPYCPIDDLARCGPLDRDMASQGRVTNGPYLSDFLVDLNRSWSAARAHPKSWMAAAGTYCSTLLREPRPCLWPEASLITAQGCSGSDVNDGVVCKKSALFSGGTGLQPTKTFSNSNYRHTSGVAGLLLFRDCPVSGKIDLFKPPPGSALFEALLAQLLQSAKSLQDEDVEEQTGEPQDYSQLSSDRAAVAGAVREALQAGLPSPRDAAYVLARSSPEIAIPILQEYLINLDDAGRDVELRTAVLEVMAYAANREALSALADLVDKGLVEPEWIERALGYAANSVDVVDLVYALVAAPRGPGQDRAVAWLAGQLKKGRFQERWRLELRTRYGMEAGDEATVLKDPVAAMLQD
jgi:pimeloyl-ACP methyl ester carboxylesterase